MSWGTGILSYHYVTALATVAAPIRPLRLLLLTCTHNLSVVAALDLASEQPAADSCMLVDPLAGRI